jgi:membrane fusion protein (multidrug efflux system)
MKVRLLLDDGTHLSLTGQAAVLRGPGRRPSTGQVTLRGEFLNPDQRVLLPGMYVRVLIEQGIDSDAIACRSRRSSATAAAAARCSSSRTTIASRCSR